MLSMSKKVTDPTRHETGMGAVIQLPDPVAGVAPEWIQLMPLGLIQPRDGRPPYELTDTASVIATSISAARGLDLPIDYDHQIDLSAVKGVGGTARAAGWIKELAERADGIWGRVEWTAAAAQAIAAKEYRFISPVFDYTKEGRQIVRLRHAALTNNPAFVMTALSHQQQHKEVQVDPFLKALLEALGLKEDTDQATALAHVQKLSSSTAIVTAMASKLGVKDTTETALAAAIDEARKSTAPDPSKFVPIEQVTELQTSLASIQKELSTDKATAAVDAAMKAGKVSPALKDWATAYASQDLDGFKAWSEKAPVVAGTSGLAAQPQKGEDGLSEIDRTIASQMGVPLEDFKKTRQAELGVQAEG